MKTKKYWILAVSIACCVLLLALRVSGISRGEKLQLEVFGISTLHGLKAVSVHVVLVAEEELGSVTRETLQTQVELELRKGGVKVINDTDPNVNAVDVGRLAVVLKPKKVFDFPAYACYLSAEVSQHVALVRNPKILTKVATWPMVLEPEGFIVGRDNLEQTIREQVTNKTNEFINDYLAANPKKEPVKKYPKEEDNTSSIVPMPAH
jgi:hypothetical protein